MPGGAVLLWPGSRPDRARPVGRAAPARPGRPSAAADGRAAVGHKMIEVDLGVDAAAAWFWRGLVVAAVGAALVQYQAWDDRRVGGG